MGRHILIAAAAATARALAPRTARRGASVRGTATRATAAPVEVEEKFAARGPRGLLRSSRELGRPGPSKYPRRSRGAAATRRPSKFRPKRTSVDDSRRSRVQRAVASFPQMIRRRGCGDTAAGAESGSPATLRRDPRAALRRRRGRTADAPRTSPRAQVPEDLEARVAALGGTKKGAVAFSDEYYDTADLTLTTRDVWLRRRDGAWELKVPHEGVRRASGGETTAFREIEDEAAIAAELAEMGVAFPEGVEAFAAFDTTREKYRGRGKIFVGFPSRRRRRRSDAGKIIFASSSFGRRYVLGAVGVDVDAASYGHAVMELEVMTDGSKTAVADARRLIAAAAADLGCGALPADAGGKLETYLKRFCPAHAKAVGLLPR